MPTGDELREVGRGDSIRGNLTAAAYNTFVRMARQWLGQQDDRLSEYLRRWRQHTMIPVQNQSGGDRDRFDVLEIDQPIFELSTDAGSERPMAKGTKPGGSTPGLVAVLLEPCKAGDVANACVAGVTVARVDLQEKWHEWADLEADECEKMVSRATPPAGAYILWSDGSTGTQLVIVRLSNPPREHFPAEITSVAAISGESNRYEYGFTEQEKTGAGHDGWTDLAAEDGGRSGTAYNLVQTVDDATCVPAQVGEIVWIDEVFYSDENGDKTTEYWFQYEEYDPTEASSSGGYETVDVVVCGGWNRCGNYIVLPQKRLYLPPGTTIEDLDDDVIPIYQCESSGEYPPESDGQPPDSDAESGDFSFSIYGNLVVSGTLTPDATGILNYVGYFNGKPYWSDGTWFLYWSDNFGCWMLYAGNAGEYWYKSYDLDTPEGTWAPGTNADGTATVAAA